MVASFCVKLKRLESLVSMVIRSFAGNIEKGSQYPKKKMMIGRPSVCPVCIIIKAVPGSVIAPSPINCTVRYEVVQRCVRGCENGGIYGSKSLLLMPLCHHHNRRENNQK